MASRRSSAKTRPRAKSASSAGKPRKPASKSASKAGSRAKSGAGQPKPRKPPAGRKPRVAKAKSGLPALKIVRSKERASGNRASRLIDQRIRDLGDWRGETLARMRTLIREADAGIIEEWKWRGTPVWSHNGIVCTGEAYQNAVKLTFAQGARLPDPARLFNSSLAGNRRRAIDIREGESVNARAFKALVKAAVDENRPREKKAKPVRLLSGGNPQIAKAEGDAPVQAYYAALPGWKRELGKRLDALIVRNVPNLAKAVKWNSPFYGVEGRGWFLGLHTFTHYLKLAFFRGASLRPLPPGPSKDPHTRYLDIREGDVLDEAQVADWVKQAAALPGWIPGRPL